MRSPRRIVRLSAVAIALALVVAACGGSSKKDNAGSSGTGQTAGVKGGTFTDLGTFVGDPPQHIDPALNTTLASYQVINALYDGLTDIDTTDPKNPVVKPLVAESYSPNADATVWTFKIRPDAQFSNGEKITPTTFQRSWERDATLKGDYSYLLSFIKGGQDRLDGKATTLAGVTADDATNTLTVTMEKPYSNFDAVAGFQLFLPMPKEAVAAGAKYESGLMVSNGPYKLAKPRTDQEIDIVKNASWTGDINGQKWPDRLDTVKFLTEKDPDTSYNAFEAGEGQDALIPPARATDATRAHGTTLDVHVLGSYYYQFNMRKPEVGGDKNLKLREAVSLAINRQEIDTAVYNGTRTINTGITPEGIPGYTKGICQFCLYNKVAAQKAVDEWKGAGNSQAAPLKIQFNAGAGHEPVVAIIVDDLKAIGLQAVADPLPTETYFHQMAQGGCTFCRVGWYADYPTYDNFMFDLFSTPALNGNNYGFSDPTFDKLVSQAKQTVDKAAQAKLFQQAEDELLNKQVGVVPINSYLGQYAYDNAKVAKFRQTSLGLILWDQVQLKN